MSKVINFPSAPRGGSLNQDPRLQTDQETTGQLFVLGSAPPAKAPDKIQAEIQAEIHTFRAAGNPTGWNRTVLFPRRCPRRGARW